MSERKKRGLGRGLGALINSDAEENPVAGAAVHAVPPVEPAVEAEPVDVSRETGGIERPIDVFFSAKSHLATQRVSRETTADSAATAGRAPRSSTTPRRGHGTRRAEMPDVLGVREPRQVGRRSSGTVAEDQVVSRETPPASSPGAEFLDVPVGLIRPNPKQPREVFDEDDMAELVHSVREIGVLQPIVVRPVESNQFELIMGERRWRASKAAGRETIPAVVRHTADTNLLRDALLENIHRSQLNPLEEAAAYQQLLDDFGISQEQLAQRIGRSRPQISNTLRLMRLPAAVQRRVAAGVLSSGHARALLGLESESQMEDLAQRIVAEGLSVRGAEEQATLIKRGEEKTSVSRETNRLPSASRVQELDEYAEALTDRLDTQVKISLGAKKGRIAIDFASLDDLERILEQMGAYVGR
ncbi:ParB/RepB/Spo0J family partition protein [Nesterenkonia muleiensis]|uniref:ParB/RepB/Spo0J family partition protein n=1 Tax=Nesterenkonia muleiensis TaxID=2282648 RepID=UPI000E73B1A2|nr:ParB/RepB/Spo0J family partition protein [Nesterenkonia muleiensis]